jgi:hypothetical protein
MTSENPILQRKNKGYVVTDKKKDKSKKAAGGKKDWTVMIYLAGDNNLTVESVYALTELKRVHQDGRINIVTQFDPKDNTLPTRRFHLSERQTPGRLIEDIVDSAPFRTESKAARARARAHRDALIVGREAIANAVKRSLESSDLSDAVKSAMIKNIGLQLLEALPPTEETETNTGSPVTLYNFISQSIEAYPAEHFMLVLGGHGAGTERDYLMKDESPIDSLTIAELRQAIEDTGQTIDILGMDSCLMSMAEVCYELRGQVKLLVGSESYVPAAGWPFLEIVERLLKEAKSRSGSVAERAAKGIVEEYVNYYSDYWLGGLSVDQSALDLEKVEGVKSRLDALSGALIAELEDDDTKAKLCDALILAHWEAQSYNGEVFVDLVDFCDCLANRYTAGKRRGQKSIAGYCESLAAFIKNEFVLKSCYSGPAYQYSHGVSIYFPWAKISQAYREIGFAQGENGAGWADFLEIYHAQTRRLPRNVEDTQDLGDFSSSPQLRRFRMTQEMGPENPVSSMRNPPLFAWPGDCIRERKSMIKGMRKLLTDRATSKKSEVRAKKRPSG